MPVKVHFIIVACIILVVSLAWHFMSAPPPAVPVVQQTNSAYSISVAHASWGLECPQENRAAGDAFANKPSAAGSRREDNVLDKVSALCGGKVSCEIPVLPSVLGGDPAPDCLSKVLVVEYRCFSYDRPWTVQASSGKLPINCDRTDEQK
jgi:hypothetical protein